MFRKRACTRREYWNLRNISDTCYTSAARALTLLIAPLGEFWNRVTLIRSLDNLEWRSARLKTDPVGRVTHGTAALRPRLVILMDLEVIGSSM